MRNFQGIIFIWIWIYEEIFKSALNFKCTFKERNFCEKELVQKKKLWDLKLRKYLFHFG